MQSPLFGVIIVNFANMSRSGWRWEKLSVVLVIVKFTLGILKFHERVSMYNSKVTMEAEKKAAKRIQPPRIKFIFLRLCWNSLCHPIWEWKKLNTSLYFIFFFPLHLIQPNAFLKLKHFHGSRATRLSPDATSNFCSTYENSKHRTQKEIYKGSHELYITWILWPGLNTHTNV